MTLSAVAKGKKRAIEETQEHDDPTTSIPSAPVLKKNKSRAETRPCPICNEPIPLRLLGKHAELEAERIDAIIQHIGSEEPYYDERDEPGPSSRGRRSAQKARKSIAPRTTGMDELVEINKTIQAIKRHRKRRHAKLKEMLKEEEDNFTRRDTWTRGTIGGQIVCPVCSETVRGDQGVLEAHVDVCVANESRRLEEARQQELALQRANMEEEWESLSNAGSGLYVGDLPGAGFHRRNRESEDVDEEIDIDGDDEAVYGEQQFTEGDILPVTERRPGDDGADGDVDIENDEEVVVDDSPERPVNGKSVAGPNPDGEASRSISHDDGIEGLGRIHVAIETARKKGDKRAHIAALEAKIKVLVSAPVTVHSFPTKPIQCPTGNHASAAEFPDVSNMSRPLQRTHSIHGMLAHVLSGVLAALPWFEYAMSNMQAYHGSRRLAQNIPITVKSEQTLALVERIVKRMQINELISGLVTSSRLSSIS